MNFNTVSSHIATLLLTVAIWNNNGWGLNSECCHAAEDLFQVQDVQDAPASGKDNTDTERPEVKSAKPPVLKIIPHDGVTCDANGNLLMLVYRNSKAVSIARRSPGGEYDTLLELPNDTVARGLSVSKSGNLYALNSSKRQILKIDPITKELSVAATDSRMHHLLYMAIAPDGRIFVADANYLNNKGSIWRVDLDGTTKCVLAPFGLTESLEVSPDGKLLYVCERLKASLWVFRIAEDGSLFRKRLVKEFGSPGIRGLKCDADGNIYVIKEVTDLIFKISPKGEVLQELKLARRSYSLCLAGPDGRTAYAVQGPQMIQFRVDRPGLAWQLMQK